MELLVFLVASIIAVSAVEAVEFIAIKNFPSTPGGDRFDTEIGLYHSKQVMATASSFIWNTFNQAENETKRLSKVTLIVERMDGIAYTENNEIHLSSDYVDRYEGDVKVEVEGVLYHEMTHVWQWDGNGTTPSGLIEGVADFVRLKAGYAPAHWLKPGEGRRWDQGYDVTARFLDYCDCLKINGSFVADLNREMKCGYSKKLFKQLLGKNVGETLERIQGLLWEIMEQTSMSQV